MNLILAALAGHRAARYVAVDVMGDEDRQDAMLVWSLNSSLTRRQVQYRGFLYDLVTCPHCVGFWLTATAVLALSLRWRWLTFLVTVWAAAGAQSTLASIQAATDATAKPSESQPE